MTSLKDEATPKALSEEAREKTPPWDTFPRGCCDEWPECSHVLAWHEKNFPTPAPTPEPPARCAKCGGSGYVSGSEHHPSCDGNCKSLCPIEVQVRCNACDGIGYDLSQPAPQPEGEVRGSLAHRDFVRLRESDDEIAALRSRISDLESNQRTLVESETALRAALKKAEKERDEARRERNLEADFRARNGEARRAAEAALASEKTLTKKLGETTDALAAQVRAGQAALKEQDAVFRDAQAVYERDVNETRAALKDATKALRRSWSVWVNTYANICALPVKEHLQHHDCIRRDHVVRLLDIAEKKAAAALGKLQR